MPLFRRMRYITTGDFFDERFGLGLGRVYSLFGIFFYMLAIGIMLEGTAKMASGVTGGALSPEICIAVMSVLFVTYGLAGGLKAAVVTDFIQGMFIVVLSFILWPFMLEKVGGFGGLHQVLPVDAFNLTNPAAPPPYDSISLYFIVIVTINTLFNIPGQPHIMEMGGSGKSEWEGRVGFTYGNMVKRVCTVAWAFIGLGAMAVYPHLEDPEVAFGLATRDLLPVGLVGVMLASMLAAVMSSCDSFMVDGAALFVENIYRPHMAPNREDHHYLNVGRVAGLVTVVGGIIVTVVFENVVDIWRFTLAIPAFWGIAVWGGIIWRRCNGYGAWAGMLGSMGIWAWSRYAAGHDLAVQVTYYLAGGVILLIGVSLLTSPQPAALLDRFYAVLHTPVGQEHKLREMGIEVRE